MLVLFAFVLVLQVIYVLYEEDTENSLNSARNEDMDGAQQEDEPFNPPNTDENWHEDYSEGKVGFLTTSSVI